MTRTSKAGSRIDERPTTCSAHGHEREPFVVRQLSTLYLQTMITHLAHVGPLVAVLQILDDERPPGAGVAVPVELEPGVLREHGALHGEDVHVAAADPRHRVVLLDVEHGAGEVRGVAQLRRHVRHQAVVEDGVVADADAAGVALHPAPAHDALHVGPPAAGARGGRRGERRYRVRAANQSRSA